MTESIPLVGGSGAPSGILLRSLRDLVCTAALVAIALADSPEGFTACASPPPPRRPTVEAVGPGPAAEPGEAETGVEGASPLGSGARAEVRR